MNPNPLFDGLGIVNPDALQERRFRQAAGLPQRGFLTKKAQVIKLLESSMASLSDISLCYL
jgi:hypothetical protein